MQWKKQKKETVANLFAQLEPIKKFAGENFLPSRKIFDHMDFYWKDWTLPVKIFWKSNSCNCTLTLH